jgi:uracil-DNA glycosylase family 4
MNQDKKELLQKLANEIAADNTLPLSSANLVFGEGNPDAEIMFIGEAPGYYEDLQGRPFVGRAGQLLDTLLHKIGWERESVYITNIVKRRPPENRDPLPEEIQSYYPYLERQIDIIDPKLIVTLGRFSMNVFLPDAKISRDHGKILRKGKRLIVPLYHTAAALRSTTVLEDLKNDFAKLPAIKNKLSELLSKEASRNEVTQIPANKPKSQQTKLF